jgi:hypothetical protein
MSDSTISSSQRPKQVKLSTKGLENTASLRISDFALRVGGEKFECNRFEAAFISPRITSLLLQDPTIDEYEVKVDSDHEIDSDTVISLISLSRNGLFEVSTSNFDFVKRVAKNLGNSELCEALREFVGDGEEVNSSNVVKRLSVCAFLDVDRSAEGDYLASHFYEMDRKALREVPRDDLKKVLWSKQLRVYSEDSLLDFVLELGPKYFDLLGSLVSSN